MYPEARHLWDVLRSSVAPEDDRRFGLMAVAPSLTRLRSSVAPEDDRQPTPEVDRHTWRPDIRAMILSLRSSVTPEGDRHARTTHAVPS
ncbi:hypothetical protein [Streptomyces sp. NPDC058011]|uniref:hypothetical protein n=1 Tax=Streptomyces sp. NPDC058011 TaxID=3346305 RepID=UPI0036EDFC41